PLTPSAIQQCNGWSQGQSRPPVRSRPSGVILPHPDEVGAQAAHPDDGEGGAENLGRIALGRPLTDAARSRFPTFAVPIIRLDGSRPKLDYAKPSVTAPRQRWGAR